MGRRTPLYEAHVASGATIVDFSGWEMPIHYGSQVAEHLRVRSEAGMFDVSHMTVVDIGGPDATDYLRWLLANDVAKLDRVGRALYTLMCQEDGGIVDDLIVYRTADGYRLVVNCATRLQDLDWLERQRAGWNVTISERPDLAMIAVQGPEAMARVSAATGLPLVELRSFTAMQADELFVGRTGYTGEDGVEIILPNEDAPRLWEALRALDVHPIGLGARDTLRLEAGLNLYGQDMDRATNPFEAGLGWTIAWQPTDRDFVGRAALTQAQQQQTQRFVGLVLAERGVMRTGQAVIVEGSDEPGVITSGSYAPSLGRSVAMARIPAGTATRCTVVIRGRQVPAQIVSLPFVRNGQQQFVLPEEQS